MKLIMEQWRIFLSEGGNVFAGKTDSIPREWIQPTLTKYYEEMGRLFPEHANIFNTFTPVGSVGKKERSGDIDLAVDIHAMFENGEVDADALESWNIVPVNWSATYDKIKKRARSITDNQIGWRAFLIELVTYINDNSDSLYADPKKIRPESMFSLFPQFNELGEEQDVGVQIDWMLGNTDWLEFSHFSDVPLENEQYLKGLHRTQLLLSLFLIKGHSFKHKEGIFDKETGRQSARTPEEALGLLEDLYQVEIQREDTNNFHSLYSWISDNLSSEDRGATLDSYLKILDYTHGVSIPDSNGDVKKCGYIPTILEDYWIANRENLGLKGRYICRDTNEKLWNVIHDDTTI